MLRKLWPLVFALGLASCATLQDIGNVLSGNSSQKITRTPIYVYKPDLKMEVDGVAFYGMGVTSMSDETDIVITSEVDIDRVEVSTCSRHDVCQIKGGELACSVRDADHPNGRFLVEKSFFGNPQKKMIYYFRPGAKEHDDSCANMMISIYDKNALAAWGFMDFRENPAGQFPARFACNAQEILFRGVSVCSTKNGTIQELNSDVPIVGYLAEPNCNIKKISDKEFEFRPGIGWCRASFDNGSKFHDVIINGYDEVLIRDGKE